jgi:FkbH-like protein
MSDVLVISDFNAELVSRYIGGDRSEPLCSGRTAPYGQLFPTLMADHPEGAGSAAFVWARPEAVTPEFNAFARDGEDRLRDALAGVEAFAEGIGHAAARFRVVLVASFAASQAGRGSGLLNWTAEGESYLLAQMNLALAEKLAKLANVYMLDSQRWLDLARPPRDARYWYALKFPFSEAVAKAAALDVKAALRALLGQSRKLVVVDLDNTLWGGVVGEEGWQGIKLGGHDVVGEAYAAFQAALKALSERGVAIAVVSKNDEAVALSAIDDHPEMVLRRSDLAGWRINWGDKAQNIVELAQELNLGLGSVVFIDDNPTERGRVADALPEVLVPEWPSDPLRYADALREFDCFDQVALTNEDRDRSRMYVEARERRAVAAVASSLEDWLAMLDVRVRLEPVNEVNLKRIVQLLNKTNQMNLRTRRMTEKEFSEWVTRDSARAATAVTVADRFGDVGLTGLISWEARDEQLEIVDYVLSCRAMGRQVENLMAHLAVGSARAAGRRKVVARLLPTERNSPCAEFWRNSGFREEEPDCFVWDASKAYPKPEFISVEPAAG